MRPAGAALLAFGALFLALPGCGPDASGTSADEPSSLGQRPGRLTCTDWGEGTVAERRGTIDQLTMLASGNANPEEVGPNRVLSDEDAYEVLDTTCSRYLARGFLLYEIYNRSAAFSLPDS